MLSPRLTNCPECSDIPSLLKKIDCKLAELGNNLYNNISYMLNKPVHPDDIIQLIGYRRILMYKLVNPNYVHKYSIAMISSKVIRLTLGCVSKCNTPERCLEEPCDITIVPNPTTTSTSSTSSTTTTTSTTTLPIIIPECSTFIVSGNTVSFYDFETNSFINLFSEGFGNWNDVANTNNKLWISNLVGIKEYDITLNPWSVNFNRDITIGSGPGLTAVDNDSLIGSVNNKIILIDISGITPTYIEIATIPSFGSLYSSSISGDIMLTNNNKLICTVQTYTEGSPDYYYTRLLQYDYPTMNLELVIDLYPILNGPWGLTENDGNIYIFDANLSNKLFSISSTYPYEINEIDILSEQVLGASIEKSCVTSSFITTTTSSSTTTTTTTIAEIFTHSFSNSSTTPEIACPKFVTAHTLYSNDSLLILGSVLYTDLGLTTLFVGNSKWYKFLSPDEGKVYQIDDFGTIINIVTCI